MAALLVLCLLFFALLQIFRWGLQTQFCEYSAFYGSTPAALDPPLRSARPGETRSFVKGNGGRRVIVTDAKGHIITNDETASSALCAGGDTQNRSGTQAEPPGI